MGLLVNQGLQPGLWLLSQGRTWPGLGVREGWFEEGWQAKYGRLTSALDRDPQIHTQEQLGK